MDIGYPSSLHIRLERIALVAIAVLIGDAYCKNLEKSVLPFETHPTTDKKMIIKNNQSIFLFK
jgi:hypothetical protein